MENKNDKKTKTLDIENIIKKNAPKIYESIPSFVVKYLKKIIHEDELNDFQTKYIDKVGVDFMDAYMKEYNISVKTFGLEQIPPSERYVFVSNHPLGGLDGICLSSIIGKKFDNKIKYIVNDILYLIDNLKPIFVPVKKYGLQNKENLIKLDEAYASDDQIIIFPAGLCSRRIKGNIVDLEWKKSFMQKAITFKRSVVPVYFESQNSDFFYRFANIRKVLGIKFNAELIYLPDEMFRKKNETFKVYFGEPIPYQFFDSSKNMRQWADYVRDKVYALSKKGQ